MKYFPFFYRLEGKHCLVIGGGVIASRRIKLLISYGALVDVISPVITSEIESFIEKKKCNVIIQKFSPELIQSDYSFIVAATDDSEVNLQVSRYAKSKNILVSVNVVDNQELCDFIFPTIIDRDPLTIAISNNGKSPILSKILKQQIDMFLPSAYGELAEFVGEKREKVRRLISDTAERSSFWESVLQGAIAEAIFSGKKNEAQRLFDQAIQDRDAYKKAGEVYLIGAGPGDPDLLTLRAFRLLQQSDVVLYDRLVSQQVMDLIRSETELVYVGKRRDQHSVPQDGINELLVHHARQGKRVARLKGGDPFIFGRGGEEIESLFDEGIPFQVVPGITAANGCSAYAGIPLTHRDYAESVQFVTGQLQNGKVDLNWKELIAPGKTLVFYMGLKRLPIICESLIENGMKNTMPVALIEKGTTKSQRILTSTLKNLPTEISALKISSPSLFIVGDVVVLSKKLNWFKNEH